MSEIKIRPGYLIQLSVRLEGGVVYRRKDIDRHIDEDKKTKTMREEKKWETERITADIEEHAEAIKIRSKVRGMIVAHCSYSTAFGLICLKDNVKKLDAAFTEAHNIIGEFNEHARHTTLRICHVRGTITENQKDALRAVTMELADLTAKLDKAVKSGDVKTIRDVAQQVTQLDKLLDQKIDASAKLKAAVKASRKVASEVTKRCDKKGEKIAAVLADANLHAIATARFAFTSASALADTTTSAKVALDDDSQFDRLPTINYSRFGAISRSKTINDDEEL